MNEYWKAFWLIWAGLTLYVYFRNKKYMDWYVDYFKSAIKMAWNNKKKGKED